MKEMDPQMPSADIVDPNAGTLPLKSLPVPVLRVLCVDDNLDISQVLRMLIDGTQGMQCVGCLASADTLLVEAERLSPDVVIIDVSMPGKDVIEAIGELGTASPLVRTIVFSASNNSVVPRFAKISGASGWLSKNEEPEIIVQAIRDVAAGKSFFPTGSSNY